MLAGDTNLFLGGRLNEPLGYVNVEATVFAMGIWMSVAAAERRSPFVAGAGAAVATLLDLSCFDVPAGEREARRRALRVELGIQGDVPLVVLVARLVPIKRVDRFLRIAARVAAADPAAHFVVVGDGELRAELHELPEAAAMRGRLHWPGFRRDMPDVFLAADVVVQTSDNEGTPVSLIEAAATGRAGVTTDVGGSASVVLDGQTGYVVARADEQAFAARVVELLGDAERRRVLGEAAGDHVLATFALDRLVGDLAHLYRRALAEDGPSGPTPRS